MGCWDYYGGCDTTEDLWSDFWSMYLTTYHPSILDEPAIFSKSTGKNTSVVWENKNRIRLETAVKKNEYKQIVEEAYLFINPDTTEYMRMVAADRRNSIIGFILKVVNLNHSKRILPRILDPQLYRFKPIILPLIKYELKSNRRNEWRSPESRKYALNRMKRLFS